MIDYQFSHFYGLTICESNSQNGMSANKRRFFSEQKTAKKK